MANINNIQNALDTNFPHAGLNACPQVSHGNLSNGAKTEHVRIVLNKKKLPDLTKSDIIDALSCFEVNIFVLETGLN